MDTSGRTPRVAVLGSVSPRVLPGRDRPPGHDPRQDRPCLTGPLPVRDDHLEEPMTHTHEKGGPPTHPFPRDPSDRIRRLRPSSRLLRPAAAMGTQPNDPVPPSPTPTPGPDTHPRPRPPAPAPAPGRCRARCRHRRSRSPSPIPSRARHRSPSRTLSQVPLPARTGTGTHHLRTGSGGGWRRALTDRRGG